MLQRFDGVVDVHEVSAEPPTRALQDPEGALLHRLGARPAAQYLVRPDGYVAYRSGGVDLRPVMGHLARWLPGAAAADAAEVRSQGTGSGRHIRRC